MNLIPLFAIIAWLACFTVLNILVKALSLTASTGNFFDRVLAMAKAPILYVSVALYIACALLYLISLSRLPLSTVGPSFMILGVVMSAVVGSIVFGESLGQLKLLGMIIAVAGVILIFYDSVR